MTDLTELRRVAEAATPGEWTYSPTILGMANTTVNAGNGQLGYVAIGQFLEPNATHIAAFDPPTVLALLDRLERAEKTIADALALFRPGASVPLGVSVARHTDRLMAEGHRILANHETTKTENGSKSNG